MQGVSECQGKVAGEGRGIGPLEILMNLWVYPLLVAWTLVSVLIFPLVLLSVRAVTRWPVERIVRLCIWLYGRGWMLFMSPFVRFRTEQMEHVVPGRPAVMVVNHLSFFDTYCMAMLPVFDITFAVRSWPFRMFWYRGFMRLANYLDVEGNSWQETLAASRHAFAGSGSVLFFPEGHRSRDGQLQRFYSGAFKVAIETGMPVIPLCITGTDRLLSPGRILQRPARIRLRALEPIETSGFTDEGGHIRLRKLAKARMRLTLEESRGEPASASAADGSGESGDAD